MQYKHRAIVGGDLTPPGSLAYLGDHLVTDDIMALARLSYEEFRETDITNNQEIMEVYYGPHNVAAARVQYQGVARDDFDRILDNSFET